MTDEMNNWTHFTTEDLRFLRACLALRPSYPVPPDWDFPREKRLEEEIDRELKTR